ncbi:hypothetical protein SELMODRAFT_418097 [Selaginella moellendorffii]|uniref:CAAX prenyl protease 2/Lysostaphin resistance protein A-like domain-containing protein n=1 Tax=Selaginella moellendorffii TaxID=88036 RepID=D8S4N4_SELML|nr:hypothetical protein SELMODRAFT_418097 [Selaginella moellendorffii]
MPASAVCTKPEDLVESLSSLDTSARLKALRDVKNQIIGNKTKKLSYIKLGAVPRVVEILASDTDIPLLVQSAAAVGSFACGTDAGVKAVLDSGVLPHLLRMLSNGNNKVVEASARSLKMIFQSTLAPKNDMFQGRRIDLILALLNSGNENVSEVAASVLARCCETSEHQKALADAGCLQSLVFLLSGSPKRKEAALDALAALTRGNPDTSAALAATGAVSTIIRTMKDKSPRARLLACMCLSNIGRACHNNYQQEWDIRKSILSTVGKLIDENGQVGEEAPGVLADLVANNEELQKTAFDFNIIERLAEAQCSIAMALGHESEGVRIAACACIKSISRSVKNLRTTLTDERLVWPLFRLLNDPSPAVQASALSAVSNVVLDFTPHKAVFFQCGGVSQLIQLALSMEPMLRLNAVWALRNLLYLADMSVKEKVMRELTVSTLVDLVCDSEEMVQEQALAFVRNLVYGSVASVQQIFAADAAILHAVERQLCVATRPEICTQALYVLSNVAAGNEYHKDAVMDFVAPALTGDRSVSILIKFLLDMSNPQLRVAAVWCISNLSFPESPGVGTRVARLRDAGIQLQLQKMFDDPCTDVKDRVKTTMEQFLCTDQMTSNTGQSVSCRLHPSAALTLSHSSWRSVLAARRKLYCCSNGAANRDAKVKLRAAPWSCGVVGSTMIIYLGGLHVPLSYSGLSIVSTMLSSDCGLDPQVKAISLVVLQSAELCGAVWLIESSIRQFDTRLTCMSFDQMLSGRRGCLLAAVIALSSVILSALAKPGTSVYLENNHYDPALKELLASGGVSLCATVAVCCGITPLLEEFVYRGFVLTSLAAYASPPWAIITSSLIFSLVHFKAPEETLWRDQLVSLAHLVMTEQPRAEVGKAALWRAGDTVGHQRCVAYVEGLGCLLLLCSQLLHKEGKNKRTY